MFSPVIYRKGVGVSYKREENGKTAENFPV